MRTTWRLSRLRQALPETLILASLLLPVGACVTIRPKLATPPALTCSRLIPPEWRQGIHGATIPTGLTVGQWLSFADDQTARLDQANQRQSSTFDIIEACEAQQRAIEQKLRPTLWQMILG